MKTQCLVHSAHPLTFAMGLSMSRFNNRHLQDNFHFSNQTTKPRGRPGSLLRYSSSYFRLPWQPKYHRASSTSTTSSSSMGIRVRYKDHLLCPNHSESYFLNTIILSVLPGQVLLSNRTVLMDHYFRRTLPMKMLSNL